MKIGRPSHNETHRARGETKLTRVGQVRSSQVGQMDRISRFGAVNSDENIVLSFTDYTQRLQVI